MRDVEPAEAAPGASGAEPEPSITRTERPRKVALFAIIAALALAIDIVSKVIVVAELADRAPIRLFGGGIYLVLARNSGAAFSLGTSATAVFTIIAVAIAAVIIRAARRLRSAGWAVALGLILGGALGNLVDRLVRAPGVGRGHVVDWISPFADDGSVYPIFNLADSAICIGGVIAVILAFRGIDLDGKRQRKVKPDPTDEAAAKQ